MSRPDIVKSAEDALAAAWEFHPVRPRSSEEVEARLPLALIVQTAAQLLPSIPVSKGQNEADGMLSGGRGRMAAENAIRLINDCFLARERFKIQVRDRHRDDAEVFALEIHLSFDKGVRYITQSKSVDEKLAVFKEWLCYIWLNMPSTFFDEWYPELKKVLDSTEKPEEFEAATMVHFRKRGFSSFAAYGLREQFTQYFEVRKRQGKRENAKKRLPKKKGL